MKQFKLWKAYLLDFVVTYILFGIVLLSLGFKPTILFQAVVESFLISLFLSGVSFTIMYFLYLRGYVSCEKNVKVNK